MQPPLVTYLRDIKNRIFSERFCSSKSKDEMCRIIQTRLSQSFMPAQASFERVNGHPKFESVLLAASLLVRSSVNIRERECEMENGVCK